jgi:stage IV sporulation protein FB
LVITRTRAGLSTTVHGVPVLFHWSLVVVVLVALAGSWRSPVTAVLGVASCLTILLGHELGHALLARRRGSGLTWVTLYPFLGICRWHETGRPEDHFIIAWGGVLFQLVVAVPLVALVLTFGYSGYSALDAVLVILGWWNLAWVAFNLLPIPPLDGATAWKLVPHLVRNRLAKDVESRRKKRFRIVK